MLVIVNLLVVFGAAPRPRQFGSTTLRFFPAAPPARNAAGEDDEMA